MLLPRETLTLPRSNGRVREQDTLRDYSTYPLLPALQVHVKSSETSRSWISRVLMLARHFAFTMNELLNTFVYTVCDERYRSSWNFKPRFSVFLIGLEVSWTFCLPLLLRCSSISFFVNTGKLSRDLHHGKSFEVFTAGFSALSAIFDSCPPEASLSRFRACDCDECGKGLFSRILSVEQETIVKKKRKNRRKREFSKQSWL